MQRAPLPKALPEVAPLDIVGTSGDEFASTLVPNNVKDGTPAHRAHSSGGRVGTFDFRLLTLEDGTPDQRVHNAPGGRVGTLNV